MSYGHNNSGRSYNSYNSDSRRNSNSFSEDQGGAKRKRSWWGKRKGGASGSYNRNGTSDKPRPLFKEPNLAPPLSSYNSRSGPGYGGKLPQSPAHAYIEKMNMLVEPHHSGPSWNWDNFQNECQNWKDKHQLSYYRSRCMALEFENQMLYQQISDLAEENSIFAAETGVKPVSFLNSDSLGRTERQPSKGSQAQPSNSQTTPKKQGKNRKTTTTGISTSDSEIEFVVNEEMMAFLETSLRHKLSLKKANEHQGVKVKIEEGRKEKVKKTDQDRKSESASGTKDKSQLKELPKKPVPKPAVGLKRQEELKQLYGDNDTLIQGLETSIQHNFNRNCDINKPQMYMTLPLNDKNNIE